LKAGNPAESEVDAQYHEQVSEHGWLSCPDNCAFDRKGRIWIATDGAKITSNVGDAVYACDTQGSGRALTRQFYRGPFGAEICGPVFTPDNTTMFLAVQHPGELSTFDKPSTRWPDFDQKMPPRPSVVAITKSGGGTIG
jgi:secreted PhoX family phosphatase